MWEILQDKTDIFYKYTEREKRKRTYRLKEIKETYRSTPTYMHCLDPDSNKLIIKKCRDIWTPNGYMMILMNICYLWMQ